MPPQRGRKRKSTTSTSDDGAATKQQAQGHTPDGRAAKKQKLITIEQRQQLIDNLQLESKEHRPSIQQSVFINSANTRTAL